MIYDFPSEEAPIRQGDIFFGLPLIELSLSEMVTVDDEGESIVHWKNINHQVDTIDVLTSVRSVSAIVISQDCDNARSRDITFCEIRKFQDVERKSKDTTAAKKWKNIITQHARINQKWFYLPRDETIGFETKMGVDFNVTIRLPRHDIENMRSLRKGRLNNVADEHFRERISEYFRRYPYDEWYSLDKEEMEAYQNDYPDTKLFPWQKSS